MASSKDFEAIIRSVSGISPSDESLYLRKSDSVVCVYSLAERRCKAMLDAGKPGVTH